MVEINCETGEVIEREMTENELAAEKKLQDDAKEVNPNDLMQTPEALTAKAAEEAAKQQAFNDAVSAAVAAALAAQQTPASTSEPTP